MIWPALLTPRLMGIVAGVALSFASGWTLQGWRADARIAMIQGDQARLDRSRAQDERLQLLDTRSKEHELAKKLQEAQDAARTRETVLRRDADAARRSAGGLRDDLAALRANLPSLAPAACIERADATADVLQQCAERYRSVAEAADRHASDVRTLMEAWPR